MQSHDGQMIASPPFAQRLAHIQPFRVMELLLRAKVLEAQGRDVIHMEIGEPDFPTPQPIVDAAMNALSTQSMQYTNAWGIEPLREAISRWYAEHYGADVPAARIIVTAGASGALLLALGAVVSPGDEVLLPDPTYPCNRNFVRAMDGTPRLIAVDASTRFQLLPQHIRAHWSERTVAALVASPANPTGTMVTRDELAGIADEVRLRRGALIVDEIYQGLVYEGETFSAAAIAPDAFIVNSFSKYFQMTGWRLGWLVVPQPYMERLTALKQNLFICASTVAQYAALAAFTPQTLEICEARRLEFKRRRDGLLAALDDIGFDVGETPHGAFYVYAGCARFTDDSYRFARELLEAQGVAATPGIDFQELPQAQPMIRFAYTNRVERIEEAAQRIRAFVAKR